MYVESIRDGYLLASFYVTDPYLVLQVEQGEDKRKPTTSWSWVCSPKTEGASILKRF